MADRTLTIHLIPSEPITGIWCHWCLLPSAVQVSLSMIDKRGVTSMGTVTYCSDCGEYERAL